MRMRRHTRVELILPSTVRAIDTSQIMEGLAIRNISSGGVFIETLSPFPIETLLEISFKIPPQKQIEAIGFVCWCSNQGNIAGMGIQFISLPYQAQKEIEELIFSTQKKPTPTYF